MVVNQDKSKLKFRRLPEDRPEQIMVAAEKVFGKYGYDATTLDRVAKAAGITKGTIYLYFKNKKDLFIRMMQRRAMVVLSNFENPALEDDSLEGKLNGVLPALREFMQDPAYPNFVRLLLGESGRFPGLAREFFENVALPAITFGKAAYESDVERDKLKPLDPGIALRCLIGMHIIFVITQELMGAKEFDPLDWDDIAKTIDTIFWDGVKRRD